MAFARPGDVGALQHVQIVALEQKRVCIFAKDF